jgi:hypothetical protein
MSKNKIKKILVIAIPISLAIGVLTIVLSNPKKATPTRVLALNTNKSVYSLNEKVEFGLGSLSPNGDTLCQSNLKLVITDPSRKETALTTKDGEITNSPTCSQDGSATNDPDYRASFTPTMEGTYKVSLKNLDTGDQVENQLKVENWPAYSLERIGPTRVCPTKSERFPMTLILKSTSGFKGQVVEKIPASFVVIWWGPSNVATVGDVKTITWEVDLQAGESKELIYEYQAPKEAPDFFTLGNASLISTDGKKVFEESRLWQIIK